MKRRAILLLVAMGAALVVASGAALAAVINCPSISGTNDCLGTDNDDRLIGTSDPDNMQGFKGNDLLKGRGGNDNAMRGDQGSDRLLGGPGDDHLGGGTGNDELRGGADFDTYFFQENNWGKETIVDTPIADASIDTTQWVRFDFTTNNLTINLNSRAGAPEVRNETGTSTLDWENNLIDGVIDGGGDDTIRGRAVGDNIQVFGGRNDKDTILAGRGADNLYTADEDNDDVIDCGDGDGAVDMVTKDSGDTLLGTSCNGDTIINVL
jgi:Ca2+-binding RTX toxin-like protein